MQLKLRHFLFAACAFYGLPLASLAAEPAPATAQTPAAPKTPSDLAYSAAMTTARERPVQREKLLGLYIDFARQFSEDTPHLGRIAGELPKLVRNLSPEEGTFPTLFQRRIAEALAEPAFPDKGREILMSVLPMIALDLHQGAAHPDMAAGRARLDELAAKFPASSNLIYLEVEYAKLLGKTDPAAAMAHLQQTAASAPPQMVDYVKGIILVTAAGTAPLELKFTSADGREVDLSKLRGKVVLVDFWATWCGPCVAELPNVKKVYAAYHDKGFEVVGIALENGKLLPKDTPEQAAAKLEVAKKILTDFTTQNEMPWPQYFDGKFWKNDVSSKYSINAIPAMFLLNQEGKVISTNARGEVLEREVKRLLKL